MTVDGFRDEQDVAVGEPAVAPREFERAEAALDVSVLWGDEVLHAEHLSPPRSLFVCDDDSSEGGTARVRVGEGEFGAGRAPLVLVEGTAAFLTIPRDAAGTITLPKGSRDIAELARDGWSQFCPDVPEAQCFALPLGTTTRIRNSGLTFVVTHGHAAQRTEGRVGIDPRLCAYLAGPIALCAAFMGAFFFLPPVPVALSADGLTVDSRLLDYIVRAPEVDAEVPDADRGGEGPEAGVDEEGPALPVAGEPAMDRVRGTQVGWDYQREVDLFGMPVHESLWDGARSPLVGRLVSRRGPFSALGVTLREQSPDERAFGGLRLQPIQRCYQCVCHSCFATSFCAEDGGNWLWRADAQSELRRRLNLELAAPRVNQRLARVRAGIPTVTGDYSAEVIRRVVRRHVNEVRYCYEQGLMPRPDIAGRVRVAFIIWTSGAVIRSRVASSTLGYHPVENCIATAVRRWSFPAPNGMVSVEQSFRLRPTRN